MDTGFVRDLPLRNLLRVAFALVILASGGLVASHALAADGVDSSTFVHEPQGMDSNLTVVTTHFNDDRKGSIAAFNESGDVVYRNASYTRYFDVDPVPGRNQTVTYIAEQNAGKTDCGIAPWSSYTCVTQIIERLDLRTDETTVLFERTIRAQRTDSWHDVDRVGPDTWAVADLFDDRAFVVNTTTGLIEWGWAAAADFDLDSGGSDKGDWTHINDVEQVRGDQFMLSLRNHDQVIFVDQETGLIENMTLGADGEYDVLYEQHNPDYIPAERGGPAVVVADSENNRIVEYQRIDGEWRRSWTYADVEMEWPRDADRLPNGNTLITDTHSNRIIEVNRSGDVVWEVSYPRAYEAERLGTGDESAGGQSAQALGLTNVTTGGGAAAVSGGGGGGLKGAVESVVPAKIRHGVLWVVPPWATFFDVFLLAVFAFTLLVWAGAELYWTDRVRFRSPVVLDR